MKIPEWSKRNIYRKIFKRNGNYSNYENLSKFPRKQNGV